MRQVVCVTEVTASPEETELAADGTLGDEWLPDGSDGEGLGGIDTRARARGLATVAEGPGG